MGEIIIMTHIPQLRIEADQIPFAGGQLWCMPFDVYNELSLGAFSDHKRAYELTAPVFFRVDVDWDLPILQPGPPPQKPGAFELKARTDDWSFLASLGLKFLIYFQEVVRDLVWAPLNLAAPGSNLPSPKLSVTFACTVREENFKIGREVRPIIHVQGDADQEYLFLPESAGPALSTAIIESAEALGDVVKKALQDPELAAAVSSLLATTAPTLSSAEQLTLSAITLEALLLPEVRSGLTKTFSRRLANLLASDDVQQERLAEIARQLYIFRSVHVHGQRLVSEGEERKALQYAYGQQLLSAAIEALVQGVSSESDLNKLRTILDKRIFEGTEAVTKLPLENPPGVRRRDRFGRQKPSEVAVITSGALWGAEGMLISWSPLIGLGLEEEFSSTNEKDFVLTKANGNEIVSLEERDIRRDFIAELRISDQAVACLGLATDAPDFSGRPAAIKMLLQRRDLVTVALRLVGFHAFIDPELLGWYIFIGNFRYRQPTVFRQTILRILQQEPTQLITRQDVARFYETVELVFEYENKAQHVEVDRVLRMFRRSFDDQFLPVETRANLLLSTVEAMLGRFRRRKEKLQLEDLVGILAGQDTEAVKWFTRSGRRFRNDVAHGNWDFSDGGDLPLSHLQTIVSALVHSYLEAWLRAADRPEREPGQVLIAYAQAKL